MNKLKERVLRLLKTKSETRKSDQALIYELWMQDMEILHQGNDYTKETFFNDFVSGRLTNTESARRVRQLLQANNRELRDKVVYEARHKKEPEYREYFSSRHNYLGRK